MGKNGVVCAAARMYGWEIETFEDIIVYHNRKTGSVGLNIFSMKFEDGKREYNRGLIPSVQFLKSLSRIRQHPIIIGTLLQILGYWWLKSKKEKLIFSEELQNFIKAEQKVRLRKMLKLR